jgi:hypothetical protein
MNHFYEESEEKIQGPIVGPMTFFRRIKVMHVQSGINNHYYDSPSHTRRALPRNAYPAGSRAPKILQEAPAEPPNRKRRYDPDIQLRPLGKVVSGPRGEYYESVNGDLRPLGEVTVNQTGQFFELVKGPASSHDGERFDVRKNEPPMNSNGYRRENTPTGETPGRSKENQTTHRAPDIRVKPYGLVYEKLFPDPGSYIRIPFGDFEVELTDQIASPDLLKPENLLDCMLQIYQIHRPIPIERLAFVELGDPAQAVNINLLTEKKALALGVKIQPGKRKTPANKQQAQLAVPGQYFFRISLLFDPTLKDENIQFDDSSPQNGYEPVTNSHPGTEESIME